MTYILSPRRLRRRRRHNDLRTGHCAIIRLKGAFDRVTPSIMLISRR